MIKFTTRLVRQFSSKIDEILDIGQPSLSKGILTICPTPIGNLADWTNRQDQALFSADIVACEDTRITGFLMKLIKNKKQTNDSLQIPENPKECDLDDDDFTVQDVIFDSTKQLQVKLPEMNKEYITKTDFKFYKQKKIEEAQERIDEEVKKQKEYLHEKDPLNFMGKTQKDDAEFGEDFNPNEFEVYGITAPFLTYLKNKIAVARKRKGRGILISCHKFNEEKRVDRLIAMLKMGLNITLVCDAGTPAISDPGYKLVNKCIERNVQIEVIPGPSAITVALSSCGFPADNFSFIGFISKEQHDRDQILASYKKSPQTLVMFESASRVHQTLLTIEKVFGEGQTVWIGFELTKKFEKKLRGKCRDLYETLTDPKVIRPSHLKGEVTIVIAPYTATYNEDLRAQQILHDGQNVNEEELEEEEKQDYLVRKVEALHVAKIFGEKFEGKDKEFSEVLQKALKISKNKATKLVFQVRHAQRVEENTQKVRKEFGIGDEFFD